MKPDPKLNAIRALPPFRHSSDRELRQISEHIVVQVPFTPAGGQACKTLTADGTRVHVPRVFSADAVVMP